MASFDAYWTAPWRDRSRLFSTYLQKDRINFFTHLRARSPVHEIPGHEQTTGKPAVLVLKDPDIRHVLAERQFTVAPYRRAGDPAQPPPEQPRHFVLQTDRGPRHDNARALIEAVLQENDLERVRSLAVQEARTLLAAALPHGRLDLARQYCRHIPLRIVASYFGLPGPDADSMGQWTRALFRWFMYMAITRYLAPEATQEDEINTTEQQVRRAFGSYLQRWLEAIGQGVLQGEHLAADTIAERLVRVFGQRTAPFFARQTSHPGEIGITLVGLANAAVDQVNMAVCNALNVLLGLAQSPNGEDREAWSGALFAARAGDSETLQRYIWEALRFDPPVPFLVREWDGAEPYFFADGMRIVKGTRVFLAISSVMMDETIVKEPQRFDPHRPDNPSLYFGVEPRRCLGQRLAEVQIVEMVKQILLLDGLQRQEALQKEELFLPKSLPIVFTPKPLRRKVQTPLTAVMVIKEPVVEHARALKRLVQLVGQQVADNLDKVGTVHFARFVFLENDTRFAIITTFDGPFETYINDFIEQVGPLFNEMLQHIAQAPPTPVRKYRREFIEYVRRVNYPVEEPFYSAYPTLTVQNIRHLHRQEGQ